MGEQDPKLKSSAAELTSIFSRLNGQGESLSIWIDEMQPDMTVRSQEIPAMVRTGRTRVMPGKMDDVKGLFREQIVPALKKSGSTSCNIVSDQPLWSVIHKQRESGTISVLPSDETRTG